MKQIIIFFMICLVSSNLFAYGLFDTAFGPTVIPIEDVPESVTQTSLENNIKNINKKQVEIKTKLNKYDWIFLGITVVLAIVFIHEYNSTIKINPNSSNYARN